VTFRPEDGIDRARREFLRGRFFTGGSEVVREDRTRPLGPPPPVLGPEPERALPCRDCPAPCTAACEPQIIRRHSPEHALAGLPYLSFEDAGCTFCNACAEACPSAADPSQTHRIVPPPRLGTATLDRDACVAWDGVICISCRLACSERAVVMDERSRPRVNEDSCSGCGMCVSVCPTRAISVTI